MFFSLSFSLHRACSSHCVQQAFIITAPAAAVILHASIIIIIIIIIIVIVIIVGVNQRVLTLLFSTVAVVAFSFINAITLVAVVVVVVVVVAMVVVVVGFEPGGHPGHWLRAAEESGAGGGMDPREDRQAVARPSHRDRQTDRQIDR